MTPPEICGAQWTNTRSGRVVHHRCHEAPGHAPPHVCGSKRLLGRSIERRCNVKWQERADGSVQCLTLAPWQKKRTPTAAPANP